MPFSFIRISSSCSSFSLSMAHCSSLMFTLLFYPPNYFFSFFSFNYSFVILSYFLQSILSCFFNFILPSFFLPLLFPWYQIFSLSSSPYILHPHHFISLSCLFVSQLHLFILICYFSSSISSYSFFLTNLSPLTFSPPCLNSYPTCTLYSPPSFLLSFTFCSF